MASCPWASNIDICLRLGFVLDRFRKLASGFLRSGRSGLWRLPNAEERLHDYREVKNDPRVASYSSRIVLINALSVKIFSMFSPLNASASFVKACLQILENSTDGEALAASSLKSDYHEFSKASVAQILNLDPRAFEKLAHTKTYMVRSPQESSISPWSELPLLHHPSEWDKRKLDLNPSKRAGDRHADVVRLKVLVDSINAEGYLRHDGHDGDIEVEALIQGEDFRFHVVNGNHRAAVLRALGWTELPVRVVRLVRKSEVLLWPKVIDGTYEPREALAIFNLFFQR